MRKCIRSMACVFYETPCKLFFLPLFCCACVCVCSYRYLSRERRLLEISRRTLVPQADHQGTVSSASSHLHPSMAMYHSVSSEPIAPTSITATAGTNTTGAGGRRMSRFEVTPVDSSQITFSLDPAISEPSSPTSSPSIPLKSILKHSTVSYPGHTHTTSSYGEQWFLFLFLVLFFFFTLPSFFSLVMIIIFSDKNCYQQTHVSGRRSIVGSATKDTRAE